MGQIFDFLSKEMMVLLVSAMPVMELRVSIPLGVSMGMNPVHTMVLGIVGSMLPVPFLLLLLKPVFERMKKSPYWRRTVDWITNRTLKKTGKVHKYKALGLLLFVAVPVPSTGVWTGSIAASLFNIPFRPAFFAIFVGNCIAAFVIMMLSHVAVSL